MAKIYILDFEETVADLRKCYKEAFGKAFAEFKIGFDESRLEEYMVTPLNEIFEQYYTGCTCKYRDFVTVFMSAFDRAFPDTVVPREGVAESIRRMKSDGGDIVIIGDTYGMYIGMFLSKYGFEDSVSCVLGIEQMAIPRPDPYCIRQCMSQMNGNIQETVLVATTERNRATAANAGIVFTNPRISDD